MDLIAAEGSIAHGPRARTKFVHAFDIANQVTPAQTAQTDIRVPLESIPRLDALGRWEHLKGVVVRFTYQVDIVAANLAAAIGGEQLFGLLTFVLRDSTGHEYIPRYDGRVLRDDMLMRHHAHLIEAPADIPDSDGTNVQRTVELLYLFGPPEDSQEGREFDGAVPLLMLADENHGTAGLFIRPATVIPLAAQTGIADNTFINCEVHAYLHADEDLVVDAARWAVRVDNFPLSKFTVLNDMSGQGHRALYSVIRHLPTDAGGGDSLADYAALTIMHGGDVYAAARSAAELARQMKYDMFRHALTEVDADFDLDTPKWIPLMITRRGAKRAEMGRLPISVECTRSGSRTSTRVMSYLFAPEKRSTYRAAIGRKIGLSENAASRLPRLIKVPSNPAIVRALQAGMETDAIALVPQKLRAKK